MELNIEEIVMKEKTREEIFFEKFNIKYKSSSLNLLNEQIPLVIAYENNLISSNSINFKRTLDVNNWEYIFVGEGETWIDFSNKINMYKKILAELSPNKIIILSDARDVFCCRSPKSYISKISKIISLNKIIVSGELFLLGKTNWTEDSVLEAKNNNPNYFWQGVPLFKYWNFYNLSDNVPMRKYVNSGLMTGYAIHLLDLFSWIINNNYVDDQLGVSMYINEYPNKIYLDYDAEILHTSGHGVNLGILDIKHQRHDSVNFAELLGHSSYFLHIPGISMSKGQKFTYNVVNKLLLDNNIHSAYSHEMYNLGTDNDKYDPCYIYN